MRPELIAKAHMTEPTEGAAEAVAEDVTLAPEVVEPEVPGADAAAPADDATPAETPAKPKQTAAERIAELTAARRQAERDAEYWRTEAQRHQQAPAPKAEPKADDEPKPDDYTYGEADAAFIRDQATYAARKAVREEMAQQSAQSRMQSQLATFDQRTAQLYPDGEPAGITAIRRMPTLPVAVMETVLASEIGPKLADHLGSNPAELSRLSGLSPHVQAYEIGKLEAKLSAKPQAKTISTAPDPAPQVRGAGGQFKVAPDTEDFAAFKQAYTR